ncbi:winged helix-turn-helix domain-containing protein [Halogeometricum luteum]|uniref:Winged helix-turn-helix domain-containing protein n=1 Tax=Halogeometricum luteum TaxID=2950537 RepID=A0ABU2FVP5_9EURY|nr:winged helix-turn-helix domain-containing protein [Halogeometricum sp. S3BR5-2]MDS0292621.1 winged helix-turn-helix domain-containing protein [Halogeometricum sp. S3BR5-2]
MSADDTPDDTREEGSESDAVADPTETPSEQSTRERLEAEADRAVSEFDENIVDLLAWLLDTETRARIYVYLRQHPHTTSDEVADGTGLYPSTVREALAELHSEETVTRRKRKNSGAGNNPYEYTAIAPSDLVQSVVGQVQSQLNTVFNLDRRLLGDDEAGDIEPVTITVRPDGGDD